MIPNKLFNVKHRSSFSLTYTRRKQKYRYFLLSGWLCKTALPLSYLTLFFRIFFPSFQARFHSTMEFCPVWHMEFLLSKYWECYSRIFSGLLMHIKMMRFALYFTWTQTEQKCEIQDLTTKLFLLLTGLSWWYRVKHYIDTNARSISCNKTSEQWCEKLALLVNIKHWDYILSAEDDIQEMEPKHCKNFTQFQVKPEGQWLTSVWKIKQHLELCSGDDLS